MPSTRSSAHTHPLRIQASEYRDKRLLVTYGARLGHRAVFKRLGYLVEQREVDAPDLLAAYRARRSAGLIALDPPGPLSGGVFTDYHYNCK